MTADLVARGLALQARPATPTAIGLAAARFAPSVTRIDTSGYAEPGQGPASYINDALATAAMAAAHPRFCKTDANGRHWRLLPDDRGMVPVSAGGATGFSGSPSPFADTGLTVFSAAPWQLNLALSSAGVPGPGGTSDATRLTATEAQYTMMLKPLLGPTNIKARVKAETAERVNLIRIGNASDPNAFQTCWFDLTAGAVTLDEIGTGAIAALGGGWFEISITTAFFGLVGLGLSSGSSYASDIGDTALLYDFEFQDAAAEAQATLTNEQPIIQDAINYCEAIHATGTRYDAPGYALWRKHRNPAAPLDIHSDKSGLLLQTTRSHIMASTCGGTILWRRDSDGTPMTLMSFDLCDPGSGPYVWRGSGLFTDGRETRPADISENSIRLIDMLFDGGITETGNGNAGYVDPATGDGFDVTDKGLWQANDRYCGHMIFEGRSGFRKFMGELVYGSGIFPEVASRNLIIGPDCEFGHTNGSCINGNGQTMKIERCNLHDAYIGVEGWTGNLGGYLKARFTNINRNSLQGGVFHPPPGSYYTPERILADEIPLGEIDLILRNCNSFEIGSWIRGKVLAVDCTVSLGNAAAFSNCENTSLEITVLADQNNVLAAVALFGGGSGLQSTRHINVRVNIGRSELAAANGRAILAPAYSYGSLGPGVYVEFGTVDPASLGGSSNYAGTNYDNRIGFRNVPALVAGAYFDMETGAGTTMPYEAPFMRVASNSTVPASYGVSLPVSGIPIGSEWDLRNIDGPGRGVLRLSSGLNAAENLSLGSQQQVRLRFNGASWDCLSWPQPLRGLALITVQSGGGAIPAGGLSDWYSIPVAGAFIGQWCEVRALQSDLGTTQIIARVSASNTVSFAVRNLGASALTLSAINYRASCSGGE